MHKVDLMIHMAHAALEDIVKYDGGAKCACEDGHVMERVCDIYEQISNIYDAKPTQNLLDDIYLTLDAAIIKLDENPDLVRNDLIALRGRLEDGGGKEMINKWKSVDSENACDCGVRHSDNCHAGMGCRMQSRAKLIAEGFTAPANADFEAWSSDSVPVIDIAAEYGEEVAKEYQDWIYYNEK